MYVIQDKKTQLFVGLGHPSMEIIFDLFHYFAGDQIYETKDKIAAEEMCTVLNKVAKLQSLNYDLEVVSAAKRWA